MSVARRCALAPVALLVSVVVLMLAPAALAKTPKVSTSCEASSGSIKALVEAAESVPAELSSPLEAGILSRFALLRRAALANDQIPALSPVGAEVDDQLVSYYPGYVRQVKVLPNGSRYFLIPGFVKPQSVPPAHCLPASERRERPKLVEQEHKLAAEPVYCIVGIGHGSPANECEPFAQVEQSPRVFAPTISEEPIVELIPDGVSSVRITYATGSPLVAGVNENEYSFATPEAVRARGEKHLKKVLRHLKHAKHATKAQQRRVLERFLAAFEKTLVEAEPRKVEWLGAGGAVLRTITPPAGKLVSVGKILGVSLDVAQGPLRLRW
jgi:hypothetical protein